MPETVEETVPAEPEPVLPEESKEEKEQRFRAFADELMKRLDNGEDVKDLLPQLHRWRDDAGLDRDSQRLVRNFLVTVDRLGNG